MHTVFPLYKKVFPLNYRWTLDPHVPLWPFFRQYKQGAVTCHMNISTGTITIPAMMPATITLCMAFHNSN
jgi:hypothetical protein